MTGVGARINLSNYAATPIAVMGLGKSGMAAATVLAEAGADVWAWDDALARRDDAVAAGLCVVDLHGADLAATAAIVWSPGIPHTHPEPHPVAERARACGTEIVCDVELLYRAQREACYIGVTGTNGKSTTTALIGHILAAADRPLAVGGNLGTPALALAPLTSDGIYVLELSSYQLELLPTAVFDVAVLLNVTADHLDRHGGLAGYVAAKARIFRGQQRPQTAIVGVDDGPSRRVFEQLAAAGKQVVVPISTDRPAVGGVYVDDGRLIDATGDGAVVVADLADLTTLPGQHNAQNAAAAAAAVGAVTGLARAAVAERLADYPGLPHRQELVDRVDGVLFVNDSKATNADAAARALACYDAVYWIAGGRPKEDGLAAVTPYLARIRHAFLIGEAAAQFADELGARVASSQCGDLATAVSQASAMARAAAGTPGVVLLSPAGASFDQFANFEARGDAFRGAVAALPGQHGDPLGSPAA